MQFSNYTEAAVESGQWAVEDPDSDTGENSEAAEIRGLCNRLFRIKLNY